MTKFRAWDDELGFMVDPSFYFVSFDGCVWFNNCQDGEDELIEQTFKLKLMEFTDKDDKSGKQICEGDILRDDCGELYEVVFGKLPLDKSGDCVCTYEAFYCKCYGKLGQAPFYECQNIGEWMEIIGNIYENPELLGDNHD